MLRNTANQRWRVFAFDRTTNQEVLGDAINITAKLSKDYGAATALTDVNPTETEDGFYLFDISQAETNAVDLAIYPESATPDVQVIGVPGNFVTEVSTTPIVPTPVVPPVTGIKATLTAFITGQTLYWFPLSRSLVDWATYRVEAVESAAPNLGKYSATLDADNADLGVDPDAPFVLFLGAAQPSSFSEGLQTTNVIELSASVTTKTVLTSAESGLTAYWFPISRSLDDWETYRRIATEASAPNTGRYSATLYAVDADLTSDPYATFVLFGGAAQPSSFNVGLQTVSLGLQVSPSASVGPRADVNYQILQSRVGHYLFGIRRNYSSDQEDDINDCLHDGLRRVYAAHDWSFLHPIVDINTTAPYATGTITIASGVATLTGGTFPTWAADGVLQVNNRYYSVASRGGDTQITLDTTSVTIATASSYQLARPEIPLNSAFESVTNDSDLTYYPSPDCWYPPVKWRHDATIRQLEGNNPEFDRPVVYSVRTVTFDPTVGSRKVLALYPTPDQVYTLRVPMHLRPVLIDDLSLYAIGGELLSQVILEACLASAEHNFEERDHIHEKRFMELIGLAIRDDQDRSSPTSLGRDIGDRSSRFSVDDYAYRLREQRMGGLTLDGSSL